MRFRKIKDKDINAAAALMRRAGISIDSDCLARRIQRFQYRRNHSVVVAERHGTLISLMHIGIEPSLIKERTACIYAMFVDPGKQAGDLSQSLIAYGKDWAKQHGASALQHSSGQKIVLDL